MAVTNQTERSQDVQQAQGGVWDRAISRESLPTAAVLLNLFRKQFKEVKVIV
jgi:hypothetical protein